MPNRANIIEGLKIAEKYEPKKYICAEHDIIYVLDGETKLTDEDRGQLEALGFHVDSESGSWAAFV